MMIPWEGRARATTRGSRSDAIGHGSGWEDGGEDTYSGVLPDGNVVEVERDLVDRHTLLEDDNVRVGDDLACHVEGGNVLSALDRGGKNGREEGEEDGEGQTHDGYDGCAATIGSSEVERGTTRVSMRARWSDASS